METIINSGRERFLRNKADIVKCMIISFLWGFIAHGYIFITSNPSHDGLSELYVSKGLIWWKMSLGRIFNSPYLSLSRGFLTQSWLIGILSFFYLGITLLLIKKIFDIRSDIVLVLTGGVMAANITAITAFTSFMHEGDVHFFTALLAVTAVYLWRNAKHGFIWGIIPTVIMLGIYQSYLSLVISLITVLCIIDLVQQGEGSFKKVLTNGLQAVAMIIISGAVYFVVMKICHAVFHVSVTVDSYNSIATMLTLPISEIIMSFVYTWMNTPTLLCVAPSVYSPAVHIGLTAVITAVPGIIILKALAGKNMGIKEKLLTLALIISLPLGLNICRALAGNMSHDLMHYAIWMVYFYALALTYSLSGEKHSFPGFKQLAKPAIYICVALIVWGNVRLANETYTVKEFESRATLSAVTRVVQDIEAFEQYLPGKTPVAFVGDSSNIYTLPAEYKNAHLTTGAKSTDIKELEQNSYSSAYFRYVVMTPMIRDLTDFSGNEQVKDMACYPKEGCMKIIDGVLVVKLSE